MKRQPIMSLWLSTMAVIFLSLSPAFASHPGGNVDMLDANGESVMVSGKPYSPKMTCGKCHNYESHIDHAIKTQVRRSGEEVSYSVPFPLHGVTAGYHFQQGRNLYWNQTARDYYKLASFTSSPGMYGKY